MPSVTFQTDQGPKTVNFSKPPTQQDIEDVVRQQGWKPAQPAAASHPYNPKASNSQFVDPNSKQPGIGIGSVIGSVGTGIKKTATALINPIVAGAKEVGKDTPEAFGGGIKQVKEGASQFGKNGDIVGPSLQVGAGVVNTAFSPLAAALKPVNNAINYAADKASDIPAVQKAASSKVGTAIADNLDPIINAGTIAQGALAAYEAPKTIAKGANLVNAVGEWGKPGLTNVISTAQRAAEAIPKPDILTKSAEQLRSEKIATGLEEQNTRLKTANQAFTENTKTYTNPDGTKTTVTPIDTFGKYDLTPEVKSGKIDMGSYQTGEGALGKIKTQVESLDTQIDKTLKSSGKVLDIDQLEQQAIDEAKANPQLKRAGKVASTVAKLQNIFADYKESYGDKLDITELNEIRKVANHDFHEDTMDTSRIIGNTARDIVYNATDDQVVKKLLRQQGELLAAKDYAETINGTAVSGGRLGNYVMRTTGAIIGATVPKIPVFGPLLGAMGGEYLSRLLQQAQFKSTAAGIKSIFGKGK